MGEGLRLMPPRLDPAISNRREWRPPLLDRAIKGDRDEARRKRAREPMPVSEMPLTTSFQPYLLAYTDGKGTE